MSDETVIADELTADGTHVKVVQHSHAYDVTVWINGHEAKVVNASLYRDGGTRSYHLEDPAGELRLPRKIGNPDHTPRWTPA